MPDTITSDHVTLDHAAIHRALGWPPPQLDEDGAVRTPTALELARWRSCDPAILATMTPAEVAAEIAHRAPAIAAVGAAPPLATVRELRARDRDRLHPEDAPDDSITDREVHRPAMVRGVEAALVLAPLLAVIDHMLGVAPIQWTPDGSGLRATVGQGDPIVVTIAPVTAVMRRGREAVGDWRWSVNGGGSSDLDLADAKANAINAAVVEAYQRAELTPIDGVEP